MIILAAFLSHQVKDLEVVDAQKVDEKIQIKVPEKVEPVPVEETLSAKNEAQLMPQNAPLQMPQFSGLLGVGSGPGLNAGHDNSASDLIDQAQNQDRAPQVLVRTQLEYPIQAKAKGQKGYVVFKALISESGTSVEAQILQSEPRGVFDSVVLNSLKSWKFSPGILKGKVVSMWVTQKVRFDFE